MTATPPQPVVGLVMIVKNEAAVIERALRSARPFISTWLIVDTGSTDATQEIIRRTYSDLSGELVSRPWVDFGTNRTEALELCRGRMDWAIMLDADDTLEGTPPPPAIYQLANLDGFLVRLIHGGLHHERIQIFRVAAGWYYEGKVHEHPFCRKVPTGIGRLPEVTWMETRCEGARSQDPAKYRRDAAILEAELMAKPGDGRTLFYLAQSYRDAGMSREAEARYREYLAVTGAAAHGQERYIALMNLLLLTADPREMFELVWQAIDILPHRLEAPYAFLRRWRAEGRPITARVYAVAAFIKERQPRKTGDDLFINPDIYKWALDDELAIAAFETGHYRESMEASLRCLMNAPAGAMRENALKNAQVAQANMERVQR